MPTYYPQLPNTYIITQVPYEVSFVFDNVNEDAETGMRFSFARRGSGVTGYLTGPSGYPQGPLGRFAINYPLITHSEMSAVRAFMTQQRGRWGRFSVVDPQGNLVKYSEDFSKWGAGGGTGYVLGPFGHLDAMSVDLSGGISQPIGMPNMNNWLMCVSVWAQATAPAQVLTIGIRDQGSGVLMSEDVGVATDRWIRPNHFEKLWTAGQFEMVLSGNGVFNLFGAQASPSKGPGGYARSPENYGLHLTCRFDTDALAWQSQGPEQLSLTVPCVELGS